MIKELIKLANHLDSNGFVKEADYLDRIIKSAVDPVLKSTNMPGAKDKIKNMFKKNRETYDIILKIIAKRNLPKTADQYIEDWSEILLKDWDGRESTLDKFLEKPVGEEDKDGNSKFIKWFESIINGGEKAIPEKDLNERVFELLDGGTPPGKVFETVAEQSPSDQITPAEIDTIIKVYNAQKRTNNSE